MKNILAGLSFLVLITACKKKIDELPEPTQTGANTFGAKVDGSFFVPQGFGAFPANNILEAHWGTDRDLYINARNFASSPNEKEFELYIKSVRTPGVYPLNTTTSGYPSRAGSYGYYVKRNITPQNEWITSSQYTGSITITKVDTINQVVAGTFEFNAINLYNTPQAISVTEGRFDIKPN